MTSTTQILQYLLLGGILGLLGQAIRVLIGLKKTHEVSSDRPGDTFQDHFDARQLWISLFIGFVSGSVGILTLVSWEKLSTTSCLDCIKGLNVEYKVIMQIIAFGYAGTDFIEGLMKKEQAK